MKSTTALILFGFAFSVLVWGNSSDLKYDCSKIPAPLLNNAKSVLRIKKTRFEIISKKKAIEKVKFAITIFNKEERKRGAVVLFYDQFKKIDDLEGAVYNAKGEKVRELESDDIKDYSACGDNELSSDLRVKVAELYDDNFPYTVEYDYTLIYKGYLNWPEWIAQPTFEPVEQTRFEVVLEKEKELRYWRNADSLKPKITIDGNQKRYLWEAGNLPKLQESVVGSEEIDYTGIIKIAPGEFEIDGFEGNMLSWKDFGSWFYSLYKDKDKLPAQAKIDIAELIKPGDDALTKVQKIYNYMQKRTRYVSIQLGIGGWMPYDASFVHQRGYGDCKALVNYTHALLKEAGIASFPALIYNGKSAAPLIKEFTANQFNHVVLCVPVNQDTLWLECTSQFMPMGLIHSGIIDRYALLVSENGGQIVHTPPVFSEDNTQYRNTFVNLNSDGNAKAVLTTAWKGIPRIQFIEMYQSSSPQERERWIQEETDIPNLNLKHFSVDGIDSIKSTTSLKAEFDLPKYASVSGKRIFLTPNLTERRKYIPPDVAIRLAPVRFTYPHKDADTVTFSMPEGYKIETLPGEVKLESSFGKFYSHTTAIGDKIVFTRILEIFKCTVPAPGYKEYRDFMAAVVKADKAQVILIKE